LLGGLAQRSNTTPERVRDHLVHITDKARDMVTSLDEIVWSLNPKHDSLGSLSKYFCEYAQQFLQLTPIRCRMEVAEDLPDCPLTSEQRHHLLLAFKEALTNVVRHAQATEVRLGIAAVNGTLIVTVTDNGQGLAAPANNTGGDGLANLSRRLEQLGGRCEMQSAAGAGTSVRLVLPLPTTIPS
jgi:signal transduction histidine kinase